MKHKNLKNYQDFSCEFNLIQRTLHRFKRNILKLVTKKSMVIFSKSHDLISQSPLVDGFHELEIKSLTEYLATEQNFNDFFLDIGANIGLNSCQSGKLFKEVHLFEPNPDCVHILKVNTRLNLAHHPHTIYEFGLGEKDEQCILYIPTHNWGGAFILSSSNHLDESTLSLKDEFQSFNPDHYLKSKVDIKDANQVISALLLEMKKKGYHKGVVKIDTEGCEEVIIKAIENNIPENFELAIIFENLSQQNHFLEQSEKSTKKINLFKIEKKKVAKNFVIKVFAMILPFFKQHKIYYLQPIEKNKIDKGNFLLLISN